MGADKLGSGTIYFIKLKFMSYFFIRHFEKIVFTNVPRNLTVLHDFFKQKKKSASKNIYFALQGIRMGLYLVTTFTSSK